MAPFQATILGHDDPQDALPHASRLVLIDNYDSFTYNVAQYLFLEGATVEVVRNDALTLQELIAMNPTQLVVSPGPGHPDTDSGISNDAIKHFAGKIPVLGVCMGQQCMYTAYGGTVASANEILHGKTSNILHDSMGVYSSVDQSIPVTRYHSLAGTPDTLPSCLEVTSWTDDKGVIMGVRHKEYVLEGVQYHPESILTLTGRFLFRNFLRFKGGKWSDNDPKLVAGIGSSTTYDNWRKSKDTNGTQATAATPSKLDEIYAHRKVQVTAQKLIPSQRPSDLSSLHNLDIAPPLIDFVDRLKSSPYSLALMAEIKRASPSKGIIDINANAAVQARRYALAGAATISVLTEPEWFKGSIEDLRAARAAVEGLTNRPAILRKEFVFEEYQILEARLAGADTVLLIVKMLPEDLLINLYVYSQSLGMEPLVEVNSADEMKIALKLGAKVIGVNNRDLHSFKVDLGTTSSLVSMVPDGTVLCALSGISDRKDVEKYEDDGVGAVLVGESLMRAGNDPQSFVEVLMGKKAIATSSTSSSRQDLLVKICGTRTPDAAKVAAETGADLVGIILVTKSKRCVNLETASAISRALRSTTKFSSISTKPLEPTETDVTLRDFFKHHLSTSLRHPTRTLLVGVFQNQPLSYILHVQRLLELDIVQLHGQEPLEWAHLIPVPVLRAFKPEAPGLATRGYHCAPLLDAGTGGSGSRLEQGAVQRILDDGVSFILAGGLGPENVRSVIESFGGGLSGVDVSSGVETDGEQDAEKIVRFIKEARGL